jgi:Cu+-exporting ATPase
VVSLFTLLYWLPTDIGKAINAFTSVLIVACPCAVALSIPFTFGNVIRIFAKQGIYFKNVNIIESLAKIDRIVFDKTGTITSVQSSKLIYEGENLSDKEKQLIFSLSRHSTHPVSKMIQQKYGQFKPLEVSEFYEEKAKGIAGFVEGALIRIGSASFIKESNPDEQLKSSVYIEIDNSIKGRYVQETSYRHGLSALLNDVKSFAKISLISGDNDMEKARLVPYFGADAELCFDQTPKAKLEYINRYQEAGQRVAMIGDGLNDAGALSQSDVGIVITENTANFTPACDVIMDARQFEKIPLLFNFSRLSIRIVMFSYAIALVYNVIGLTYAVQGLLSPVIAAILMPLSSVTIVVFGVFMSRFWASRKALL